MDFRRPEFSVLIWGDMQTGKLRSCARSRALSRNSSMVTVYKSDEERAQERWSSKACLFLRLVFIDLSDRMKNKTLWFALS